MTGGPEVVIVGGGLAALRAAERLRERGFGGYITMIGDEPGKPYNRPPLSKQMVLGKMRESELSFQTFTHLAVELRSGQRVMSLDTQQQCVTLDSGEELFYDGLIIATGVVARKIPTAPQHDDRVVTLRTLADFRQFEAQLTGAKRIAIIGGGFIGCEVAASARARSLDVTIIDQAPVLLQRILGDQLGGHLTEIHRRAGVDVRTSTGVTGWATSRAGVRLDLSDNTSVQADAVLVAIGTAPAVDWLDGSGIETTDGVLCDETCHVVGLDNVVAAGDVARWPNLRFSHVPRRVEHWINAVEMGRAAADSLLDGTMRAKPFTPVPRFWSEQHGIKIQSVGMPALGERIALVEGDLAKSSFVAAFLKGPRLVGAISFNSARALLDCAEVVEAANTSPILEEADRRALNGGPRRGMWGTQPPAPSVDQTVNLSRNNRSTLVSYYGGQHNTGAGPAYQIADRQVAVNRAAAIGAGMDDLDAEVEQFMRTRTGVPEPERPRLPDGVRANGHRPGQ